MAKRVHKKRRRLYIAGACALILAALLLDSRYRLTVSEYRLEYENLPESFRGFRIVQLSDLHLASFGPDNERLAAAVEKLEPDLIALTGDFLNRRPSGDTEEHGPELQGFLTRLAGIAPCYFVSGNHEWASGEARSFRAMLEGCGIDYLSNEYVLLEREGKSIVLAGVEDPNAYADMATPTALVRQIREELGDKFTILLGHRDDWPAKYPDLDVDLLFCGHGHGGIIRLPFAGGLLGTDFNFFPEYDGGVYNNGGYDLVVSRGLGNSAPVPRFLNPPEIVSVILDKI